MHARRLRWAIGLAVTIALGSIWFGWSGATDALAAPAAQTEAASGEAATPCPPKQAAKSDDKSALRTSLEKALPIIILVLVVGFVLARLPKIEGIEHSAAFRRRRVLNWLPLGLTYAFLYMGRYNLQVSKSAFQTMRDAGGEPLMGNADFGLIFMVGTITYGVAFVFNGPLTDRFGGKRAILLSAAGAAVANLAMGLSTMALLNGWAGSQWIARNFVLLFSLLYALNMYFQSFGAVAVVKVNAPWFHLRERGVFGAIFGILISLGVYFAFDWSALILKYFGLAQVFIVPAVLLVLFWIADLALVADTPGDAGHRDFDTADASSGDDGRRLGVVAVFSLMLRNPIIMTIACIEFCSGFLRQAIMQWYTIFAAQTDAALGLKGGFVSQNWGLLLCVAGILGGVVAGVISDRIFQARRGPVALLLYVIMLCGALVMTFAYQSSAVGPLVIVMSMAVIGVHGMLSGTASMDFGGKKNVGVAVGLIDGFVYLGTGTMSLLYGFMLPQEKLDECKRIVGPAADPDNWQSWPISMIAVALVGTLLATRVWHARPQAGSHKSH
ncbi:MAG TPA: MFS transporter [Kofleriaceae bacterium]|nr:MFS transporter [Kofleriaceae bacterium]